MKFQIFTKGDVDGFFGLMIDNLIQILVLSGLCMALCGFPIGFITSVVLPATALSIIFGNVLYSIQAYKLSKATNRTDVTALPYGINTVSLFAFIFFVMFPAYQATRDYTMAWKAGLLASFVSGLIEVFGSFIANFIRKSTPRAALLSALSGIAITFISMDFLVRTFQFPLITFLPLALILLQYFGKIRFPFGIPGGLLSVFLGMLLAFLSPHWGGPSFIAIENLNLDSIGFYLPKPMLTELLEVLTISHISSYFAVILPMGIFNVIGSLQNIESAEASGDSFDTRNSLLINGAGTLLGTLFGSPFPTTIYIGHPGWKALGARYGYSILNGVFIALLALFGLVSVLQILVPIEAGMAIVLWIGIVIASQSFQTTPKSHSPAVVMGLLPAFAGWGVLLVQSSFQFVDSKLQGALLQNGGTLSLHFFLSDIPPNQNFLPYALSGILSLSQGFLITSMVWASIVVFIIERDFWKAGIWSAIGSLLSVIGLIHAYTLSGNVILNQFQIPAQNEFWLAYGLLSVLFFSLHFGLRKDLPDSV